MLASGRGQDDIVALLIEFGANLESTDKVKLYAFLTFTVRKWTL
jgi:hypothetical protein